MDRFVYSLNGTLVVYGYENFDKLTPIERNDAILLPKRQSSSSDSELDTLLESSFCTMSHITFDDLRNNFNDPEYDVVDDDDDVDSNFLGNNSNNNEPPATHANHKNDKTHNVIAAEEMKIPRNENCSISTDAIIRYYFMRNKCVSPMQNNRLWSAITIQLIAIFIFTFN